MNHDTTCPNCNNGQILIDSIQLYSYRPIHTGATWDYESDSEEYIENKENYLTCSNQCGFKIDQKGNMELPDMEPVDVSECHDYLESLRFMLAEIGTI